MTPEPPPEYQPPPEWQAEVQALAEIVGVEAAPADEFTVAA